MTPDPVLSNRRRTVITHGRLAMQEHRLHAARQRQHGLQVMSFQQLAVRLAGGLVEAIDDETLRLAVRTVLPVTGLPGFGSIKDLPGMVGAASATLRKVWRAGIDLDARSDEHERIRTMAELESAVLEALPRSMLRPAGLVEQAMQRLDHVATLTGPVEVVGISELSPVWRPLLHAIATRTPVRWQAGPRPVPAWLDRSCIEVTQSDPCRPDLVIESAATHYHEALEAMRWARALVSSGTAAAADIAIASVSPGDYDDHFMALRADADLDLHFVHGISVLNTRPGQAAAALADILVRGLSQSRVRRLSAIVAGQPGLFATLPPDWTRILPEATPLTSTGDWKRLFSRPPDQNKPDLTEHLPVLRDIIDLLSGGTDRAGDAGEAILDGRARQFWRRALRVGVAASIDRELALLRQGDDHEACASACWMPADALAISPRRFVRLLGLNSARWPRSMRDDSLLGRHIIPIRELEPLPLADADRRDFLTIQATTAGQVVMSRARRGEDGRLLGRSPLLVGVTGKEIDRARNRLPEHACSESDRLMARPVEFSASSRCMPASRCWRNWQSPEITAHDGRVRRDHPALDQVVNRTQSATSLQMLLRNPIAFLWRYGLRWQEPEPDTPFLMLDARSMGELVHDTLDLALGKWNAAIHAGDRTPVDALIECAVREVSAAWETERPVPPKLIWQHTLDELRQLVRRGLASADLASGGSQYWGEVPFGEPRPKDKAKSESGPTWPWDHGVAVEIPGTGMRIAGYIDRLGVSAADGRVQVCDYKTGKMPSTDDFEIRGGRELQRCLYAFAAKALLDLEPGRVDAALHYLRDDATVRLDDPEKTLLELTGSLQAARDNLASGHTVIGVDSGGDYDDFRFALPANCRAVYQARKIEAAKELLGAASGVWEVS